MEKESNWNRFFSVWLLLLVGMSVSESKDAVITKRIEGRGIHSAKVRTLA